MKVKCITTSYWPDSYECIELDQYITRGNIYEVQPGVSKWVWSLIDDRGEPHDIVKACFIPLRDINLDKLV
jgi:hypothetical protein